MIDIAEKTKALIEILKTQGVKPIPECQDIWSYNYAIFRDVIPPYYAYPAYAWQKGIEKLVNDHFAGDPFINIKFYWKCEEIEISRKKIQ